MGQSSRSSGTGGTGSGGAVGAAGGSGGIPNGDGSTAGGATGVPELGSIGSACTLNIDCMSPLVCAFGLCHVACAASTDCVAGERCVSSGGPYAACLLPVETSCADDTGCLPPLRCSTDHQCRTSCASDGDCLAGERCIQSTCGTGVDGGASCISGAPCRVLLSCSSGTLSCAPLVQCVRTGSLPDYTPCTGAPGQYCLNGGCME